MTPLSDQLRSTLRPLIQAQTIAQTARLAGLHRSRVSAWLSGRIPLPLRHIDSLAKACGVVVVVKIEPTPTPTA